MLGAKLGNMSKADAEKEMVKIVAVAKVGKRHAKSMISKAHATACKERKKLEREVKAEMKKTKLRCNTCKPKAKKRSATKRKVTTRKPAKTRKR